MSYPTFTLNDVAIPTGLYIGGKWVKGRGPPLETLNPATEQVHGTVDTASKEDVDDAVKAAREAFETTWGLESSANQRGELMFRLAELLEKNKDELAQLEAIDCGKPVSWCRADIEDGVMTFKYYAGAATKIEGKVVEIDDKEKFCMVRKEPIGVVGQIVPWNYPLLMMIWKVAPALAAGCAIVFKAAEQTPLTTLKFAELVHEAGYPAGSFNLLNGTGAITGAAMSVHMDIDKIAFTGSTPTGRKIVKAAADSNLKQVSLELGGKSPMIVFDSADLEEAAKWCAFGAFECGGQSCNLGSRVLVQNSIYDKFMSLYIDAVKKIKVGDPLDTTTFQGPQVSKLQFDKIMGYIESGKASNKAKVLLGGNAIPGDGYFIEPTIFSEVDMSMEIGAEEIFGPVSCVFRFEDEVEALKIANDTSFGLAAGIFTNDLRQSNRVTRKLRAGTVWVNQYVMVSPTVPFGGYKQSGWGRDLGLEALDGYLISKAVHQYYGGPLDWPVQP